MISVIKQLETKDEEKIHKAFGGIKIDYLYTKVF